MKYALAAFPAPVALTLRFGLAATCLLPWARHRLGHREAMVGGGALGLIMLVIFALLATGIHHMSAPRCAFLMAMTMVFVQLAEALRHRRLDPVRGISVVVSVAGVVLVTGWASEPLSGWDLVVLAAAVLSAMGLGVVHLVSARPGMPPAALTFWQLCVLTAGFAIFWLLRRPTGWSWQPGPTAAVVFLGVFPSALAQLMQMLYQRYAQPSVAVMIYALKPLFASLLAALLGEHLRGPALIGGAMMVASAFCAPLIAWRRQARTTAS